MTLNKPVSVLQRMRLACTPVGGDGEVLHCAKTGECSPTSSLRAENLAALTPCASGRRWMAGHERGDPSPGSEPAPHSGQCILQWGAAYQRGRKS